jgi:hypothetical protein
VFSYLFFYRTPELGGGLCTSAWGLVDAAAKACEWTYIRPEPLQCLCKICFCISSVQWNTTWALHDGFYGQQTVNDATFCMSVESKKKLNEPTSLFHAFRTGVLAWSRSCELIGQGSARVATKWHLDAPMKGEPSLGIN